MTITKDTRLADLLAEYPWLKEKLPQISEKFKMLNSPVGKIMLGRATILERMRIVDDAEDDLKRIIATGLCRKFTDDEDFLQKELTHALPRAAFMELSPEHITGKLVNES